MELELITSNEHFRSLMGRKFEVNGDDNKFRVVDGDFIKKFTEAGERNIAKSYLGGLDRTFVESYEAFVKQMDDVATSYKGTFEKLAKENVRLSEVVVDKDAEIAELRAEIELLRAENLSACGDVDDAKRDIRSLKKANKELRRQNKMLNDSVAIAMGNVSLMQQRSEITEMCYEEQESGKDKCFTSRQQSMAFVLMLEERGINVSNTHKKTIAEMISTFTGRSFDSVRRKLDIDFDDEDDRKNLRIVGNWLSELMPGLANKIFNSISDE